MGYYTRYLLTWEILKDKETPNCEHQVIAGAKFCHVCGVPVGSVCLDEIVKREVEKQDFGTYLDGSAYKWYEWENDIRAFSKRFPDVVFILDGEGEETGDIWRAYVLNEKIQFTRVRMVMDKFDPSKLADTVDTLRGNLDVEFV